MLEIYIKVLNSAFWGETNGSLCNGFSLVWILTINQQFEYEKILTLIYPAHFEDVPCQSGVNHIFEGKENYVSRQGIYHCKEECLSFIKKQTEIQIYN